MVRTRSAGRAPGWAAASAGAVLVGLVALSLTAALARPLGLRPAVVLAELALATPALVVAALFGGGPALLGQGTLDGRVAGRALATGAALWLLSLGLMDLQARAWPPPPGYLDAFRSLHAQLRPAGPSDALVSVAVIAVVPAVCEELVFRGVVLPAFGAWLGTSAGLLVSSLLFGAIHIDQAAIGVTAYRVPFAVVVGLGFGLLRLRCATLAAPVLAHTALNTLTFAAVPLFDEPFQSESLPHPAIAAALVLVGALAAWRLLRGPAGAPAAGAPDSI